MESLFNSEDFTVRESPFSSIADAHTYSSLTENPNINGEHIIQRENTSYERGMDFTALDVQEILDDPQILTNEFLMNFSEEDFMDDYSSEGSQEEFEALHQDEIRRVSGLGKRKHKLFRGRTSGPNEQPEVARYLQLANGYYISKQFDNAIEACEAAIQLQPRADKAYSLLGVMAEERGDMRRALSMYLFMAHIVPREADLWRRLAVFAKLHGSPEEIVVCLRKAMFANQKDTLPAWQLIQHFEQTGESNSQIDTYRQILKHVPYNMHLIRDLVVLFLKKNRYRDACQWIYDALVFHSKGLFNTPWVPPAESLLQDQILREGNVFSSLLERISFSTYYIQDLNSLPLTESTGCASIQDLYLSTYLSIKEGRYSSCLILVKRYFLFLQGKPVDSNDEEIEAMDDSNCLGDIATFMKRGHDFDKSSEILTDFHTILGLCRLHLNQDDRASTQFQFLLALPFSKAMINYGILLDAYYFRHCHELALTLISRLLLSKPANPLSLWISQGQHLSKLNQWNEAKKAFHKALEFDPGSYVARSMLVQIYRKEGRHDLILELTPNPNHIESPSHLKQWLLNRYPECANWLTIDPNDDGSGGEESARQSTSEKSRRAIVHERMRIMACKEAEVKQKFDTLAPVWSNFLTFSDEKQEEILKIAKSVFLIFSNTDAFYPSDRSKTYAGLDKSGRLRSTALKKVVLNYDEEYQLVNRRRFFAPKANYDPEDFQELNKEDFFIIQANSFLGFSFDSWFELMMQYCIALVKRKQSTLAFQVLEHISESNVYWHNDEKMLHLHLIGIALGVKARNFLKVSQFCRWLITHYPYRCDIYRIYCAVLCSGHDASNIFTSTPQQKFLRRILVHRFRGTLRKHMTPQEVEKYGKQRLIPVKDVSERIWAAKPILLMTYGHSMSYSGSVCDAINYYIKAYALVPHDPLINLQLGLMHLYRSMQRMTENRHLQDKIDVIILLEFL
ncbi:transcription factor TFIIIC subunit tfc4 [Coelomomyces lativittatus]|nr:transcription factor TFIIIC subunit tfc4 [Coelomomyces lativittatus]